MPDKPSDQSKIPDFPDDEEIRRQLRDLGFKDEDDDPPAHEELPPTTNRPSPDHPELDEIDEQMRKLGEKVSALRRRNSAVGRMLLTTRAQRTTPTAST